MEAVRWRRSTKSEGTNNCVEMASSRSAVRDSKNTAGPVLLVPLVSLVSMLKLAKTGGLDLR